MKATINPNKSHPKRFCKNGHDTVLFGRRGGNCLVCYRAYMLAYRKTESYRKLARERAKVYAETHRESVKAYQRGAVAKAAQRAYRVANPHLYRMWHSICKAKRRLRIASFGQDGVREFYRNCPVGYVVDHIIPLQGRLVSGLHVLWNLQYLTEAENHSKGNKYVIQSV